MSAKNDVEVKIGKCNIIVAKKKKKKLCNFLQKKLKQTAKCSTVKVHREKGEFKGDFCKVQMV